MVGVGAELATGFKGISLPLTLESLLSSDMLDEESGLSGGEESTCNGPSSSSLTSDGVCKGAPGCFVLCSSSCALQNSCSKELANSLNSPTSSQFFRKRVGVGVWSAMMTESVLAGPNFNVISCLCLWTDRWSSFVNLCPHPGAVHTKGLSSPISDKFSDV